MKDRYTRAARMTAPARAAQTAGLAARGYWLDNHTYFFISEHFDPDKERLISVPCVADLKAQEVREAMSLGPLAAHRLIEQRAALGEPALYSPDGRYATVVRKNDLSLIDLQSGFERPLTIQGTAECRVGQQPETCLSALSYRKRPAPMGLWSPDSKWFLTHVIDERALPDLSLVEHVPPGCGRPIHHSFKYSMPGDPLPVATYVAIHIESREVISFPDWPMPVMTYSPFTLRTAWFEGSEAAWVLGFDRYRRSVQLIRLDLLRQTGSVVLSEAVKSGYIDLNPMYLRTPNVRTLSNLGEVIWFSERDGWGHLYLYDIDSCRLKNQITRGAWIVRDIVHVDEAERKILFLAGGIDPNTDPVRRTLCRINFDGSGFEVLCAHDGDVFVPQNEPCGLGQERPERQSGNHPGVSPDGRYAVVRYASAVRGNRTEIVDLHGGESVLLASAEPENEETVPRSFEVLAADGVTRLHGLMFLPSDFDERRRYPLVDYIYPGPQSTHQPQSFRSTNSSQATALAELGFVTIMLDTRGMPGRSRAFHQMGYGSLLEPQLADHAATAQQLCKRHAFLDAERIGIFGWSAGGAATVRALCDYSAIFKVGVSVCGSHDASLYAAGWSDRYRGPKDPEAWAQQANVSVVDQLEGKLLLISGDMDENVHVSQTLVLVNALIVANRDFDLLIVPNAGHDVLMTNPYVQRRTWDYFVQHLLREIPPEGFAMQFDTAGLRRYAAQAERELRE